MNKIIFLTGNFASGKTTISKIIEERFDYKRISGDEISLSLFPGEGIIVNEKKKDKYQLILQTLFEEVDLQFDMDYNLIVDYVIFKDEIEKYKQKYKDNIDFFVLLPDLQKALNRNFKRPEFFDNDKSRMEKIDMIFKKDKDIIGKDNFIDTSSETIKETITKIITRCKLV